uniref:EF-hand domain-containing protein n=1 Tax=Noctiluca scintillans TaxID=2966 RepID=A0A7S1AFG8_NOCSC
MAQAVFAFNHGVVKQRGVEMAACCTPILKIVEKFVLDDAKIRKATDMVFDSIDTDHNGQMDSQELRTGLNKALVHMGITAPVTVVNRVLKMVDKDKSGGLNKDEFAVVLTDVVRFKLRDAFGL